MLFDLALICLLHHVLFLLTAVLSPANCWPLYLQAGLYIWQLGLGLVGWEVSLCDNKYTSTYSTNPNQTGHIHNAAKFGFQFITYPVLYTHRSVFYRSEKCITDFLFNSRKVQVVTITFTDILRSVHFDSSALPDLARK